MKKSSISSTAPSVALLLFFFALPLCAQGAIQEVGSGEPSAVPDAISIDQVPIRSVSLFSSGVGYFQREGRVQGSGALQFRVNVADMNDLLKSMVLRDLDGGTILGMNYAPQDPLSRALAAFAVDLSGSPGVQQILGELRGERVEVVASESITGVILGVEERTVAQADGAESRPLGTRLETQPFVDLYTAAGIRSVSLNEIRTIRFLRPELDREIRLALGVIASNRNKDKKQIVVRYAGTGSRRLVIGYLQETPVWKTSYRLSVDQNGLFMQGWALVENTTDQDWSNVRLNLVSGKPISFTMDLYTPIYLKRPEVSLGLSQAVVPPAYESDLSSRSGALAKSAPAPSAAPSRAQAFRESEAAPKNLALDQGVESAALAGEAGSFFQYSIREPVTIRRRESAMVPIVNEKIDGRRVAIYNDRVDARHPLNGLQLTNSTGLELNAGPITVFEDGQYAGDARIENLAPGAERLLSYSVDLKTEVSSTAKSSPDLFVSAKIGNGVLVVSRKLKREREYTIRYDGDSPRTLLIEYPLDPNWILTSPASASEKTRSLYRFDVPLKPSSSRTFTIAEERTVSQSVALSSTGLGTLEFYARSTELSTELKTALARLMTLRSELETIRRESSETSRQLQQIYTDQKRIRENMAALDRTSGLYNRYVSTLSSQEDQISKLTTRVDNLKSRESSKKQEIDTYLSGLKVN